MVRMLASYESGMVARRHFPSCLSVLPRQREIPRQVSLGEAGDVWHTVDLCPVLKTVWSKDWNLGSR